MRVRAMQDVMFALRPRYYLQLSNSKEYNGVLEKEHCFLVRNAILLKACTEA